MRKLSFLIVVVALGTAFRSFSLPQAAVAASVTVRIAGDKTTFRIGEEIPLELEFRGNADSSLYFSTETYDRSGRMMTERYSLTPAGGFIDPLADLYVDGMVGGGIRSEHPLDDTPFKFRVSLNDWVRFTRPGIYRLTVTSSRLHRRPNQPGPTLEAAPAEITVAPFDVVSAAAQVQTGLELIDKQKIEDVKRGTALLRYVDTQDGAKALIERFEAIAKTNAWDIEAALISSTHRPFIISQMESRLDDGAPLSSNFIGTLSRLRSLVEVPPVSGNNTARFDRSRMIQAEYDARWRAALARRPATVATLRAQLARLVNASAEVQQQIVRDLEEHPVDAAEAFAGVDSDLQRALLESRWALVNRPWMLPALRKIVQSTGEDIWGARGIAAGRLSEVAPDEGRRFILDEIRTGRRKMAYEALAILPEPSLPELDAALQERYGTGANRETTAWLISRYGSEKLLPFVSTLLSQPMACMTEAGLVAYLLKHDTSTGMTRLDPGFNRSRGCVSLLQDLSNRYWDERVEVASLAHLRSANSRQVSDAAMVLGKHGSAATRRALLERFTTWNGEWQGRAAELVAMQPGVSSPALIENNIVNALLQNPRFNLAPEEISRMRALCVTDSCRNNLDARTRR